MSATFDFKRNIMIYGKDLNFTRRTDTGRLMTGIVLGYIKPSIKKL